MREKGDSERKKKTKDVNIHREWVKLWLGAFLTLFGMGIVGYGIVKEPQGVIDYSVVSTFGVVLGWAGAMFGIDSHAKIRMHEQDTEFELKSKEIDERMRQFDMRYQLDRERMDDRYRDDGRDKKESET